MKFHGLARDTLILFLLLNLFNLLNFGYHFVIARVLTPADYGILAALIAIAFIFAVSAEAIQNLFAHLTSGLNVTRQDGKIKYLFKKGLQKGFIYSLYIFIALLGLSIWLCGFLKIPLYLLIYTHSMLFLLVLSPVPRGILQGRKEFTKFGLTFVIEGAAKLVFAVILVFMGFKVFGALTGIYLGLIFGFGASLWFLADKLQVPEQVCDFPDIYKVSIPFFATNLILVALLTLDIILARKFFSPELAGYYAVLSILGKIIYFASGAMGKAMFPSASEHFAQNRDTASILTRSFGIILGFSVCVILLYALFPELTVRLAFGIQYMGISPLLVYSGIAFALLSFGNLILLYGLSTNRLTTPAWLIGFVVLEAGLLSFNHSSLKEYILALLVSHALVFIGSSALILWPGVRGRKRLNHFSGGGTHVSEKA